MVEPAVPQAVARVASRVTVRLGNRVIIPRAAGQTIAGTIDRTPQLRAEHAFLRGIVEGRAAANRSTLETITDAFVEVWGLLGGF